MKIQLRRDTKVRWEQYNPILATGEVGIEIDTNRIKIGNETTEWNSLEYVVTKWNREVISFTNTEAQVTLKPCYETLVNEELTEGKKLTILTDFTKNNVIDSEVWESRVIVTTGETIGTITFPEDVVWRGDAPELEPNTIYRFAISIYSGLLMIHTY